MTNAIALTAKTTQTRDEYKMLTVFASSSVYSLGQIRVDADGSAHPFCFGARQFGYNHSGWDAYPTLADALAAIRADFDAAVAHYDTIGEQVFALLRSELSPVVPFGKFQAEKIIVGVIDCEARHQHFKFVMTPSEALTAMDYLSDRSNGRFVPTIEGWVMNEEKPFDRPGYAKWEVPYAHSDYVVAGWSSTTGKGRRDTVAFHAAINRAA